MRCNINQTECFPGDEVLVIMTRVWPWFSSGSFVSQHHFLSHIQWMASMPTMCNTAKQKSADPADCSCCKHLASAPPQTQIVRKMWSCSYCSYLPLGWKQCQRYYAIFACQWALWESISGSEDYGKQQLWCCKATDASSRLKETLGVRCSYWHPRRVTLLCPKWQT